MDKQMLLTESVFVALFKIKETIAWGDVLL